MFVQAPAGAEPLLIQPVVIPRRFAGNRLYFFVVFSLVRENLAGYVPCSLRRAEVPVIPACLTEQVELTGGGRGYWPAYIHSLIRGQKLSLEISADNVDKSLSDIRLETPRDLGRWSLADAEDWWRRLIPPMAVHDHTALFALQSAAAGSQFVSLLAPPAPTDEINPEVVRKAVKDPWSATDLRPGLRLETINTRRVANEVQTFVAQTSAPNAEAPEVVLRRKNDELLRAVAGRDPRGDLTALFRALQRPPEEDPHFEQHILPALRATPAFADALQRLMALRDELLLRTSRSEFLRQSRFVDSARNRAAASSGVAFAAKPPCFERQIAELRQHPGLMRRLYLTLACSVPWRPASAAEALIRMGTIGLSVNDAGDACVRLMAKTKFTLDCTTAESYFRPAPAEDKEKEFFGADPAQKRFYYKYHTFSRDLYQVSQDDPSRAMLRASEGVSDGNQEIENARLAGSIQSPPQGLTAADVEAIEQSPQRNNAVNIYHRPYSEGWERTVSDVLQERVSADLDALENFNQVVTDFFAEARRLPGPIEFAAFNLLAARFNKLAPPIFHADNLMQGYTVHVQARDKRFRDRWRSLNRRQVTLSCGNKTLEFEEEGNLGTSIVQPPRPLTGTVTQDVAGEALTIGLLANDNRIEREETVRLMSASSQDPTDYISDLKLFNTTPGDALPRKHDTVLIGLRGRPSVGASGSESVADQVYTYPVLRAAGDSLSKRIKNGSMYAPFSAPVVLRCTNEVPPNVVVRDNWRASIVFAPHFTRLVDASGRAVQPADQVATPGAASDEFKYFTVEAVDRMFVETLGEVSAAPPSLLPLTAPTLTNLGFFDHALPMHLPADGPREYPLLPDLEKPLEDAGETAYAFPTPPNAPGDRTKVVVYRPGANLEAARGRVSEINFLFLISRTAPNDAAQPIALANAAGKWYLLSALPKQLQFRTQAAPSATDFSFQFSPSFPATLLTELNDSASAILRGRVEIGSVDANRVQVVLSITSADVARDDVKVDLLGERSVRWILNLERASGVTQIHYAADLVVPPALRDRCLHPLETERCYIEVVHDISQPLALPIGPPQLPLGTVRGNFAYFPDGESLALGANASETVRSGWLLIRKLPERPVSLESVIDRPLILAAEVADSGVAGVRLVDAFGQSWTISAAQAQTLDLPSPTTIATLRKLREVVPGEWLVLACDLAGSQREVAVRSTANLARAQAVLWGRLKPYRNSPLAQAAEGAVEFAATAFQSVQGRALTVWAKGGSGFSERTVTGWSLRMVIAKTLAEYREQPPAGMIARFAAEEPTARPHHLMVSELIARWSNWYLGLPLPGRADVPAGQVKDKHFQLRISPPQATEPADHAGRRLPPQRFGRQYAVCLRRTDLAGNHVYDEPELPHTESEGNFSNELESIVSAEESRSFVRTNLPLGAVVAFTPEKSHTTLGTRAEDETRAAVIPSPEDRAWEEHARGFLYLPSPRREPHLTLVTDVFNPTRVWADDATLEVLPPAVDVETMILHGALDRLAPQQSLALIRRHERYFDLPPDTRLMGRLKSNGDLNYLPDPAAELLTLTVRSLHTQPIATADVQTRFYHFVSQVAAAAGRFCWPNVRWIRVQLQPGARIQTHGRSLLPLPTPRLNERAAATTIAIELPPGAVGEAILSLRPAGLENWEYARMARDFGSDRRTVRLTHAVNAVWTKPLFPALAEAPHPPEAPPSAARSFSGQLQVDRLTAGFYSFVMYWNDPWDESVPVQHEPGRAVIRVDAEGKPASCELLDPGFGFGEQAIVVLEGAGHAIRKPQFRAVLKYGRLTALQCTASGVGCNVLFRVKVTQSAKNPHRYAQPAEAIAWYDDSQQLWVQIVRPGLCLGPETDVTVVAERPALPNVVVRLQNGSVKEISLGEPGSERFTSDFHLRIERRPPFYRTAEANVVKFDALGGIREIQVTDGGGYYDSVPLCVAHDPEGDGWGAELVARVDEFGSLIGVRVVHSGRRYSAFTQIRFYNNSAPVPEVEIPDSQSDSLRSAAAQVVRRDASGGIEKIDVTDGGGSYTLAPVCVAHDLSGSGTGAELIAELDTSGRVAAVRVKSGGANYSERVELRFQLAPVLAVAFRHAFPNVNARRVDVDAVVWSRFRHLLRTRNPFRDLRVRAGGPLDVRDPIPRFARRDHLELLSHHPRMMQAEVRYLMPVFVWEILSPRNQPQFSSESYFVERDQGELIVRRLTGARVYLNRPWNSTGPEQLAVVIAPASLNTTLRANQKLQPNDGGMFNPAAGQAADAPPEPAEGYVIPDYARPFVTRPAFDPVWNEHAFPPYTVDHFSHRIKTTTSYECFADGDAPSGPDITFRRPIQLALHETRYDAVKELWYADILIAGHPKTALPFVQLAVARFQEHALPGRRLSPVTTCDLYKFQGTRELKLQRRSQREFRVALSGEFDQTPQPNQLPRRRVVVRLETRDPNLAPEIESYVPPATSPTDARQIVLPLAEWELKRDGNEYRGDCEMSIEAWNSARFRDGRPSTPVLAVLEYEDYPSGDETQTEETNPDLVQANNRKCAARLVYSFTCRIGIPGAKP